MVIAQACPLVCNRADQPFVPDLTTMLRALNGSERPEADSH